MIKKVIKIFLLGVGAAALLLVVLIIIGVLLEKGIIGKEEKKPQISIKYTPRENMTGIQEDEIPDSDYYETLQEALKNNGVVGEEGGDYEKNIDEIIKSWGNDKYVLIFFRSVKDKEEECFTIAKFKKKIIDKKECYVFLAGIPSYYAIDGIYIENIYTTTRGQLDFTDYMQNININQPNTRFIYGESIFKEIEKLKIEGQKPTEIIPYEVFGEKRYFWYYDNFQSDKAGSTLEFTL